MGREYLREGVEQKGGNKIEQWRKTASPIVVAYQ